MSAEKGNVISLSDARAKRAKKAKPSVDMDMSIHREGSKVRIELRSGDLRISGCLSLSDAAHIADVLRHEALGGRQP